MSFDQSARGKHAHSDELPRILDARTLPDDSFDSSWDGIIIDVMLKDRLLSKRSSTFRCGRRSIAAVCCFTASSLGGSARHRGKRPWAEGSKTASLLKTPARLPISGVEPHGLASSSLGRSQQAVLRLLNSVIAERAQNGPLIVLLDEVETLAADRSGEPGGEPG